LARATRVSVIIPTYNEESTIEGLLQHLLALGADEIIVVDGSSRDRTTELVRRFSAVRLLETQAGRGLQMNAGAKVSSGDVLLFLHADVRLSAQALPALRAAMRDDKVMGGNFNICYAGDDFISRAFTIINRYRRRAGIFYGDSGIFCREKIFISLGGYRLWPLLEDYEFARRLLKTGRLSFLEEIIYVSNRRWNGSGVGSTMWRWVVIQGLYSLGVSPQRLASLYQHIR